MLAPVVEKVDHSNSTQYSKNNWFLVYHWIAIQILTNWSQVISCGVLVVLLGVLTVKSKDPSEAVY